MVNLISNIAAHSVPQILFQNHREIEKSKVTPSRLNCEFTAVDENSLLIELLCMLCIIFSVGFSLRLLKGSYIFPKYSKNFISPLAELLRSFERNHHTKTQRRQFLFFRLIFGQYSNFRGLKSILRGYMDTRITWICYSSQLDSGLVRALFCSLYQPISLSRSLRQGIRAWFPAQSGTADQVISLLFSS